MNESGLMKIFFFICLFLAQNSFADFSGEIFEMNSNKGKKLYSIENKTIEKDSQFDSTTTYSDLSGQAVFVEKTLGQDARFSKVEIEQKQINAQATVEIKEGKIYFSKTENGKTKTSDESLRGDTVISSSLTRYVKSKWADLMASKEVEFRIASWERMETVGFELKKMGTDKVDGQDVVTIRMKASSFIIAALVNPITFRFAADGSRLVSMSGRVAPKQKKGDSWKDLDGDVFYTHK